MVPARLLAQVRIHLKGGFANELAWLLDTDDPQVVGASLPDVGKIGQAHNTASFNFVRVHFDHPGSMRLNLMLDLFMPG